MTHALIYLFALVFVATMVFLLVSVVFGRGEELAPLPPGASPTRLPAEGLTGADVNALRFQQVMRGYKMSEVDWVLDRMARELDDLRAKVAGLSAGRDGLVTAADPAEDETTARSVADAAVGPESEPEPEPESESESGEVVAELAEDEVAQLPELESKHS